MSNNHLPVNKMRISELKSGKTLINLGVILEIHENADNYSLVIDRYNEKLVLKFEKNTEVYVY